jgi:hypothetical protein
VDDRYACCGIRLCCGISDCGGVEGVVGQYERSFDDNLVVLEEKLVLEKSERQKSEAEAVWFKA